MPFLRICTASGEHEWGFEVPHGFVPAVGDHLVLWCATPDLKDEEEGYDCELINAVVAKRIWDFGTDFLLFYEVKLEATLEKPIPKGFVTDSTEWPSSEKSKREKELEEEKEREKRRSERIKAIDDMLNPKQGK